MNERSVGEVDLREGVVEASEGVAQEGASVFGEEAVSGFHIEDDGRGWVGRWGGMARQVRWLGSLIRGTSMV